MNAMCSTKQDHVLEHVEQMRNFNYRGILVQTSCKKYNSLDNSDTRDVDASRFTRGIDDEFTYMINLDTERIHKKGCPYIGDKTIRARLINIPATGLKVCKHCMK